MTPYCSGLPIDSIPDPDPDNPDLLKHKAAYHSIYRLINWLAIPTFPDVATVLTFLSAYQGAPNHGHYEVALHALIYLVSTCSFGLAYHSDSPTLTKSFVHFPPHHDAEAYLDATPPRTEKPHESTSYSNACWGSLTRNYLPDDTELTL